MIIICGEQFIFLEILLNAIQFAEYSSVTPPVEGILPYSLVNHTIMSNGLFYNKSFT
jgi:hypothetical protein